MRTLLPAVAAKGHQLLRMDALQPQFLEVGADRRRRRIAYRWTGGEGPPLLWLSGFLSDMASAKATAVAAWTPIFSKVLPNATAVAGPPARVSSTVRRLSSARARRTASMMRMYQVSYVTVKVHKRAQVRQPHQRTRYGHSAAGQT